MLLFSVIPVLLRYLIECVQQVLPLKVGAVAPVFAFNTASSFMTNTNWQDYSVQPTAKDPAPIALFAACDRLATGEFRMERSH